MKRIKLGEESMQNDNQNINQNTNQNPDAALSKDPVAEISLSQEDVSPTGQALPSGYEPVGEEVEGSTTPSNNTVDELANAIGVEFRDREPMAMRDKLERRDDRRYELDPDSAKD
jgi:hypothetical protein